VSSCWTETSGSEQLRTQAAGDDGGFSSSIARSPRRLASRPLRRPHWPCSTTPIGAPSSPEAPLRRWGLMAPGRAGGFLQAPLVIDAALLPWLLGTVRRQQRGAANGGSTSRPHRPAGRLSDLCRHNRRAPARRRARPGIQSCRRRTGPVGSPLPRRPLRWSALTPLAHRRGGHSRRAGGAAGLDPPLGSASCCCAAPYW